MPRRLVENCIETDLALDAILQGMYTVAEPHRRCVAATANIAEVLTVHPERRHITRWLPGGPPDLTRHDGSRL